MLLTTKLKNKILTDLAWFIAENKKEIIQKNKTDLDKAGKLDATLIDRLKVDKKKCKNRLCSKVFYEKFKEEYKNLNK